VILKSKMSHEDLERGGLQKCLKSVAYYLNGHYAQLSLKHNHGLVISFYFINTFMLKCIYYFEIQVLKILYIMLYAKRKKQHKYSVGKGALKMTIKLDYG